MTISMDPSVVTSAVNDLDSTTSTPRRNVESFPLFTSSLFGTTTRLLASNVSAFEKRKQVISSLSTQSWNNSLNDEDLFPQGCQFSPDGLCVLTSQCHRLLLYNTPVVESSSSLPTSDTATTTTTTTTATSENTKPCYTATTTNTWDPVLDIEAGDKVRSYTWYPHMNSSNPATCCFVATSRDQPVHLYDAYTGTSRASYRPYNGLDEMESPSVLSFCQGGKHLVAGGFRTNRMVQIFDLSRPGRDALQTLQFGKTRRSKDGQKGLVSAMASGSTITTTSSNLTTATETSLHYNLLAVGTYAPGSIYLYDERCYQGTDEAATITISGNCVVGHGRSHGRKRKHYASQNATENKKRNNHKNNKKRVNDDNDEEEEEDNDGLDFSMAKIKWFQSRARGGVTQLEFTHDHLLYSASRRSNAILAWDLRRLSSLSNHCPGVASFETDNDTNQRLEFAIHPSPTSGGVGGASQLWIGGRDGCVRVYDCQSQKLAGTITRSNPGGGGIDGSGGCGAVNGVSLTNSSTNNKALLLALAMGSRNFPTEQDWSSSGDDSDCAGKHKGNSAKNLISPGSLQLYEMDTSTRTS